MIAIGIAIISPDLAGQTVGEITGKVTTVADSPIVGAFISIDDSAPAAQTDAEGNFRIGGVAAGNHILHVRRSGYMESADSIVVATDAATQINIRLADKIATLAGVEPVEARPLVRR